MRKELKEEILKWLLENERLTNRLSACVETFQDYIYGREYTYQDFIYGKCRQLLIGGQEVYDFIEKANAMIYDF